MIGESSTQSKGRSLSRSKKHGKRRHQRRKPVRFRLLGRSLDIVGKEAIIVDEKGRKFAVRFSRMARVLSESNSRPLVGTGRSLIEEDLDLSNLNSENQTKETDEESPDQAGFVVGNEDSLNRENDDDVITMLPESSSSSTSTTTTTTTTATESTTQNESHASVTDINYDETLGHNTNETSSQNEYIPLAESNSGASNGENASSTTSTEGDHKEGSTSSPENEKRKQTNESHSEKAISNAETQSTSSPESRSIKKPESNSTDSGGPKVALCGGAPANGTTETTASTETHKSSTVAKSGESTTTDDPTHSGSMSGAEESLNRNNEEDELAKKEGRARSKHSPKIKANPKGRRRLPIKTAKGIVKDNEDEQMEAAGRRLDKEGTETPYVLYKVRRRNPHATSPSPGENGRNLVENVESTTLSEEKPKSLDSTNKAPEETKAGNTVETRGKSSNVNERPLESVKKDNATDQIGVEGRRGLFKKVLDAIFKRKGEKPKEENTGEKVTITTESGTKGEEKKAEGKPEANEINGTLSKNESSSTTTTTEKSETTSIAHEEGTISDWNESDDQILGRSGGGKQSKKSMSGVVKGAPGILIKHKDDAGRTLAALGSTIDTSKATNKTLPTSSVVKGRDASKNVDEASLEKLLTMVLSGKTITGSSTPKSVDSKNLDGKSSSNIGGVVRGISGGSLSIEAKATLGSGAKESEVVDKLMIISDPEILGPSSAKTTAEGSSTKIAAYASVSREKTSQSVSAKHVKEEVVGRSYLTDSVGPPESFNPPVISGTDDTSSSTTTSATDTSQATSESTTSQKASESTAQSSAATEQSPTKSAVVSGAQGSLKRHEDEGPKEETKEETTTESSSEHKIPRLAKKHEEKEVKKDSKSDTAHLGRVASDNSSGSPNQPSGDAGLVPGGETIYASTSEAPPSSSFSAQTSNQTSAPTSAKTETAKKAMMVGYSARRSKKIIESSQRKSKEKKSVDSTGYGNQGKPKLIDGLSLKNLTAKVKNVALMIKEFFGGKISGNSSVNLAKDLTSGNSTASQRAMRYIQHLGQKFKKIKASIEITKRIETETGRKFKENFILGINKGTPFFRIGMGKNETLTTSKKEDSSKSKKTKESSKPKKTSEDSESKKKSDSESEDDAENLLAGRSGLGKKRRFKPFSRVRSVSGEKRQGFLSRSLVRRSKARARGKSTLRKGLIRPRSGDIQQNAIMSADGREELSGRQMSQSIEGGPAGEPGPLKPRRLPSGATVNREIKGRAQKAVRKMSRQMSKTKKKTGEWFRKRRNRKQ